MNAMMINTQTITVVNPAIAIENSFQPKRGMTGSFGTSPQQSIPTDNYANSPKGYARPALTPAVPPKAGSARFPHPLWSQRFAQFHGGATRDTLALGGERRL